MKTKFKKLGLAAVLLAGMCVLANAQNSCNNYCDQYAQWNYSDVNNPVIATFGDCDIKVNYRWRVCGDPPRRELEITSLDFVDISNCSGISESYLMNAAIRQLLWESSWIFAIPAPGVNSWQVIFGIKPCWKWDNGKLVSCNDNDQCCINTYTLIIEDDEVMLLEFTEDQQSTANCSPVFNCMDLCEAIDNFEEESPLLEPPEVCKMDCEDDWTNFPQCFVGDIEPNNPNGCTMRVWYQTRNCTYQEFLIYRVELIEDEDGDCDGYNDIDDILNRATDIMICNLNNTVNSQTDYYDRRMQSCWLKDLNFLIPCHTIYCCATRYAVNDNCYGSASLLSTGFCRTYPPPGEFQPCVTLTGCTCYCRDERNFPRTMYPKSSSYDFGVSKTLENFDYLIKPNPAQDKLDVHIITSNNQNIEITISDYIGKEVMNHSLKINKGESIFNLDISKLTNGIYYYRINTESGQYVNNKFVISR